MILVSGLLTHRSQLISRLVRADVVQSTSIPGLSTVEIKKRIVTTVSLGEQKAKFTAASCWNIMTRWCRRACTRARTHAHTHRAQSLTTGKGPSPQFSIAAISSIIIIAAPLPPSAPCCAVLSISPKNRGEELAVNRLSHAPATGPPPI